MFSHIHVASFKSQKYNTNQMVATIYVNGL